MVLTKIFGIGGYKRVLVLGPHTAIYINSFFLPCGGHRLSIPLWKTEKNISEQLIPCLGDTYLRYHAFPTDRIWAIARDTLVQEQGGSLSAATTGRLRHCRMYQALRLLFKKATFLFFTIILYNNFY